MSAAENIRWHAAGHLAAALLLLRAGNEAGAKTVLVEIGAFLDQPQVKAPPQMRAKLNECLAKPNVGDITLLEQWLCDPFNSAIEKSFNG